MRTAFLATAAAVITMSACGSDSNTDEAKLSGTYVATTFLATISGQQQQNVLSAGGSLTLTINGSGVTSGTLTIPASIGGGLTASMAGTATQTGTSVTFTQTADTFVRDLTWTLSTSGLTVTNQTAGSSTLSITLTRQ